jgi:hypothetical protein
LLGATLAAMAPEDVETLKRHVRERVAPDGAAPITCGARANAIKGRRPA